ncbi:outer membrane beta-barrel protein [Carboxylicivirga taeanensis]|uniref:outer membrane beta-barrel protein n=1 Tax=Carboxylicivirga taeanensis TaxID=1416875 RepID=UPI003F6E39B5
MKHIKHLLVVAVAFLGSVGALAQTGVIKGRVIAAGSKESIPFASIALFENEQLINGAVSNEKGDFKIDKVKPGTYQLSVSFLGFETREILSIELSKDNRIVDVNQVSLKASNVSLQGVEVTANAQTVKTGIDRKTYNAADFATAKGGSATDVLNKLPAVSVGPDGAVSVRGTTDFMVYLNGKPTQMEASVLLGQIQSESIASIDVITVPTAKYDAQGKGGIIIISTKKQALNGLSVAANGLIGGAAYNNLTDPISGFENNDNRYGGGLSLMYHKNALTVYGGGSYNRRNVNGMRTGDARILQEDGTFYHMVAAGERPEWYINYSANAGIDYRLSNKSMVSASYYYGDRQEGRSAFYVYNNFYGDAHKQPVAGIDPQNEYVYNPNTDDRYGEFHTSNIDYSTQFDDNSSLKLSLLYEYSKLSRALDNEDYDFDNGTQTIGRVRRHFRQTDEAPLHGYRFSVDYEKVLDNGHTLSLGLQPQYITHDDAFNYDTLNVTKGEWASFESLENNIELTRGVYAAYIDYLAKWNKLTMIAGVRVEYTDQAMEIANPDYFNMFDREMAADYQTQQMDWFPTLHMNYALNETNGVTLAASRRINRPATKNMAPFLYRRHYEVYLIGDPSLEPEYLSNLEVSLDKRIGQQKFTLTGFYRGTDNAVFRVNTIYNNPDFPEDVDNNKVLIRSYTNAGNTSALGAELNANLEAGKQLKMFVGGSIYHYNVNGDVFGYQEDNSSTNWNLKGNVNWHINKAWRLTTDFDVKSATVTAQGRDELFYLANAAINYQPQKLAGWDFSLRVLDVLASNDKALSTRAYDANAVEIFYQATEYRRQGPIVEFSVNYSLNLKGNKKKTGSTFGKEQF